jgi:hypothetical protein
MIDNSRFANGEDFIREAFEQVLQPCNLESGLHKVLLVSYVYANQSGIPKLEPLSLMLLSEITWNWPWFNEWYSAFKEVGAWPSMWKQEASNFPHIERHNASRQLRIAKVYILAHTISMVTCRVRDFNKWKLNSVSKELNLLSLPECRVECEVAADYSSTIKASDWTTWPPFFPGDRTSVTLKS